MRKINYFLSLAATVAVLSSCQDVELDQDGIESGVKGNLTLVANVAEGAELGTKSSLDDLTFSWTDDDKLGVYVKSLGTDRVAEDFVHEQVGETPNSAFFGGDITVTSTEEYAYAVYPYNATDKFTTDGDVANYKFSLPLEQEQNYIDGAIDPKSVGEYTFKYGRTASLISTGGSSALEMTDLMAIHDVTITQIPAGKTIYSVALSSSIPLSTTAEVNLDESSFALSGATVEGQQVIVTLNGSLGVQVLDGTLKVRLVTFPETVAQETEWTFSVYTDKTGVATKAITKVFAAEKVYKAGVANSSNFVFDENAVSVVLNDLAITGKTNVRDALAAKGIEPGTITSLTITSDAALDMNDMIYIADLSKKATENVGVPVVPGVLEYLDISNTKTITMPSSAWSFTGSTTLAVVKLPSTLPFIELSGFNGCTALVSINLESIKTINAKAFLGCTLLKNVDLSNVTKIDSEAFKTTQLVGEIDLSKVASIGGNAFADCGNGFTIKGNSLPEVLTIGTAAFYGCSGVTLASLPKVTSIGNDVFTGGVNITTLDLPLIETMGTNVFSDGVTNVTLNPVPPTITSTTFKVDTKFTLANSDVKYGYDNAPIWEDFAADRFVLTDTETQGYLFIPISTMQFYASTTKDVTVEIPVTSTIATVTAGDEWCAVTFNGTVISVNIATIGDRSTVVTVVSSDGITKTFTVTQASLIPVIPSGVTANSESAAVPGDGPATSALDNNLDSWWHSNYAPTAMPTEGYELSFNFASAGVTLTEMVYTARPENTGSFNKFSIFVKRVGDTDFTLLEADVIPTYGTGGLSRVFTYVFAAGAIENVIEFKIGAINDKSGHVACAEMHFYNAI